MTRRARTLRIAGGAALALAICGAALFLALGGAARIPPLWGFDHVYVTGDVHGPSGLDRLLEVKGLGARDLLIVLGDFGLIWDAGTVEKRNLARLHSMPFTVLFVDGNHENFDLLERLPVETRFGGRVGRANDKLFHLLRGEVYEIRGHTLFTFGGGYSKDRFLRTEGVTWWPQEAPSEAEKENARRNLARRGWSVEFVLTHVPDMGDQKEISARFGVDPDFDETAVFLQGLKPYLRYEWWYCGHFHTDYAMNGTDRIVATELIRLF